jgi:hypothetical protein
MAGRQGFDLARPILCAEGAEVQEPGLYIILRGE